MKGGGFFVNIFSSGVGAFAAKNASSGRGLVKNLIMYALIAFVIVYVLRYVARVFGIEYFSVPTFPSTEGDKKDVTPAGNVILY